MGRPPLEKKQRQLPVALPPDLRDQIEAVAKKAGHSIAEEIRKRIAKTMRWDALDPVTMELLEGLELITNLLKQDFGVEWYVNSRAHEAFVAAVNQRLAEYAPPTTVEGSAAVDLGLVGPTDPPATIGRLRERDDQRISGYMHLMEAQDRRAKAKTARLSRAMRTRKERSND